MGPGDATMSSRKGREVASSRYIIVIRAVRMMAPIDFRERERASPARVLAFIGPWDWPKSLASRGGGASRAAERARHWGKGGRARREPPTLFTRCTLPRQRYTSAPLGAEPLTYDPAPSAPRHGECCGSSLRCPPLVPVPWLRAKREKSPKSRESLARALASVKSTLESSSS